MNPEPVEQEAYIDEERPTLSIGWRAETLEDCDWALRRLSQLETEIAQNEAICRARIAELQARTATLNAKAGKGVAFFRSVIIDFAERKRRELLGDGKKKTRELPSGSIAFRTKGGGLVVNDRDALLEWARKQPVESGFLRIKEEPAVDEIKRAFKATGELPPGTDLEPEREEIQVKAVPGGADQ